MEDSVSKSKIDTLSREVDNNSLRLERNAKRVNRIENIWKYLFAILPLLGFICFSILPIGLSFLMMFFDIDIYDPGAGMTWNNFEGFKYVFTAGYGGFRTYNVHDWFIKSIWITCWIGSTQFITLFIALFISVLIAQNFKGSRIFQVLFFIPYICSSVAVTIMWGWIFSSESFGLLNSLLNTTIEWTEDTRFMTWTIIIAIMWQAPGYGIVMYKAAMANVNTSLYEAAELDGANWFSRVIHVTLPAIRPTTFYLMMAGIISGFMTYDMASLIVGSTWEFPFGKENYGITFVRLIKHLLDPTVLLDKSQPFASEAAIISWVLFFITATLSIVIMKLRDRSISND